MSDWFAGDWFAPRQRGDGPGRSGAGRPGGGLWDAMEQLREAFEHRFTSAPGEGDLRASILMLLAEQPMHGAQVIAAISERSGGAWSPTPGMVYPTLQLLVDEGLAVAEESAGKKTYTLTEAGRAEAAARSDRSAPWDVSGGKDSGVGALTKAGGRLAHAASQVARNGTPAQIAQAVDALDEARRSLYTILAQD